MLKSFKIGNSRYSTPGVAALGITLLTLIGLVAYLIYPGSTGAAAVNTQSVHNIISTGSTSNSVSITAPVAGSLIITAVSIDKSAGSITLPPGFTLINDYIGPSVSGSFAYKVSDGSETSVTWNWATSQHSVVWAGVVTGLTINPLDVTVEADSNNLDAQSQTTGTTGITIQNDEIAVAVVAIDTGLNLSLGRSWTNGFVEGGFFAGSNPGLVVAGKILSSVGVVETTFSGAGSSFGDQMWASVATFKITPPDTTAPVIATQSDVTAEATSSTGTAVSYITPSATDNVDSSVVVTCLPVSGITFALGSTPITCTAQDAVGNIAIPVVFNIIVQDTTAPTITLNGSATVNVQVHGVYLETGASVSDIYDATVVVITSGAVDTNTVGSYVINYNATDVNGNAAVQVSRTVHVIDQDAPSTTDNVPAGWSKTPVTVTFSCTDNASCTNVYYTTDGSDPTTSGNSTDSSMSWGFTTSIDGEYTVKYFGTDSSANNESIQTASNLLKIDTTLPTVVLTAPTTTVHLKGAIEIAADATDALSGIAKIEFREGSNLLGDDTSLPYTFMWDTTLSSDGNHDLKAVAYDVAGNQIDSAIVSVVVDNTAPVITLTGPTATNIQAGDSYTDEGATALDAIDGDLTANITATSTLNTTVVGSYTITHNVSDLAGNTAQVARIVHVNSNGGGSTSLSGQRRDVLISSTSGSTAEIPTGIGGNPETETPGSASEDVITTTLAVEANTQTDTAEEEIIPEDTLPSDISDTAAETSQVAATVASDTGTSIWFWIIILALIIGGGLTFRWYRRKSLVL